MTLKKIAALLAIAGIASPALATNGYFSHGYGMKAKGMAGVGIALAQDSLAAATNPAGMVMVGDRLDIGLDWFRPMRDATIVGNGLLGPSYSLDGNGKKDFFIPEFGYNKMLNASMSLGVSVYGNGGMNTTYNSGVPLFANPAAFGVQKAGVDLSQLFIAPTFAMKLTPGASCGVSLNLAYQRFKAEGLQNFGASSADGANLTNNGYDSSTGYGARVGCIAEVTPIISLGATYQTKTAMGKLDKYKGLFAEQGDFDIPENYGIGIAVKALPTLTIAADVEKINYSGVKSIANPLSKLFAGNALGSSDGPGFGWKDMTIYKIGANWQMNQSLTLRAGYSHAKQPIQSGETFFNILAPGVIEDHLTLGATWTLNPKMEVTVAYMHGFEKKVNGSGSIPAPYGGGEANLKMYQDSLGVSFGMKF
jgi:long-chain fatty acid transport protein